MTSSPTRWASTLPARMKTSIASSSAVVRISPRPSAPSSSASEGLKRAPCRRRVRVRRWQRATRSACGSPRLSCARSDVATSEPAVTAVTALISFITRYARRVMIARRLGGLSARSSLSCDFVVDVAQHVGERQRLAELHAEAPVAADERVERLHEAPHALLLLLAAGELAHERLLLDEALVADADRAEAGRARRHAERGVDHEREEPQLGRQELARARAAAFEEELEGRAVLDQPAHVGVDHRAVEAVAGELAADEEGAGAPQDRAYRQEVEVVARRDDRHRQLVAVEDPREEHVVHVRLVRGQEDERPLLRELAQALDALLVDLDGREHARRGLLHKLVEGGDRRHVERRLHRAEHRHRPGGHDLPLGGALAGHVGDDLLQLRAADDLLAQAVGRLARGAHDRAALALEPSQQRVRQPADEHVVAGGAVLALEELGEVDRLAHAQRRVPPVREKLRDRPDVSRPLRGPKTASESDPPPRSGAARPHEDLRHEQDAAGAPPLHVEQRADQVVALGAAARAAGEQLRPALEEQRRARPAGHGARRGRRRPARPSAVASR